MIRMPRYPINYPMLCAFSVVFLILTHAVQHQHAMHQLVLAFLMRMQTDALVYFALSFDTFLLQPRLSVAELC